jgi:hypothetical protein
MSRIDKNKRCLKAFIIIVLVVFSTPALASNLDFARIMPGGKVLIYRGDQQVGELTAEAPFPDGALLACDGDCAVRMDGLLLVGADKSLFSVTTQANSRELQVRNGTVYFALSKMPHSLVFVTPGGVVTAQQLILNAAADGGLLKGYVDVTGDSAEIGVFEGGSVLVSTVSGETTIQSGKKIVLAQSDEGKTSVDEGSTQKEEPQKKSLAYIIVPIATAAGVMGISAIAAADNDSDGGGSGVGSPAAP